MDDAKRELVRGWFIKARNDLITARALGELPKGPLDTAIYHCQQAAEKAVKGFLAFCDHRMERSHDIERLVALAAVYESGFVTWTDAAITLTPYATAYRYPGETTAAEPEREEFSEALRLANDLVMFVFSRVPKEVLPGS